MGNTEHSGSYGILVHINQRLKAQKELISHEELFLLVFVPTLSVRPLIKMFAVWIQACDLL